MHSQTSRAPRQRNEQAQQGVAGALRDLRTVTAGLRGDFAQLPGRIEHAARGPLAQYASTCTALLEGLAERGERMAERMQTSREKLMGTQLMRD